MNTYSALMTQFPLSPRKFIKKMVGAFFKGIFFALLIAVFLGTLSVAALGFTPASFLLAFVIVLALGLCIAAWYWSAYIRTYYYDASSSFLTIRKGAITPTEIHVQYQKIQDVYVDQDIWDRMLGLYDVHIASATATSGIEAHIDGVDARAAEGLKQTLLNAIKGTVQVPVSGQPPEPQPIAAQAAAFSGEISNNTYPISSRWLVQSVFRGAIAMIVALLAIVGFGFTKTAGQGGMSVTPMLAIDVCVFVGIWIVSVIIAIIWKRSYRFQFLPDYLYVREGVVAVQEKHVPYNTIQDVVISQGLLERILGIATVVIQNAAAMQYGSNRSTSGGITIPGQPYQKAQEISEAVKSILAKQRQGTTGL